MGSVDDSLADVPEPERACLQRVIDTARTMVPEAVEGMSYGMPALKLDGKPLIGVVAAAKHLSVFPFSPAVIDAVAGRLAGYSLSKGTIRFPTTCWRTSSGCAAQRSSSSPLPLRWPGRWR
jgi:uncharacterized protein YdhG (YjbR/CyaY superfamily)